MEKVAIVGAGPVGIFAGILLSRRGYSVDIYETRPDPRKEAYQGGRSISLTISRRGWHAFEDAGIADQIRTAVVPLTGRFVHKADGSTAHHFYGKEGESIDSISRVLVIIELLNAADKEKNLRIHFISRCLDVFPDKGQLMVSSSGKEPKRHAFDRILACDGAYSSVRMRIQTLDRFDFSQEYVPLGYKELSIPPGKDGYVFEKGSLHVWPRNNFLFVALPEKSGGFIGTLFLRFEGDVSFASLDSDEKVLAFFKREFPDLIPVIPDLVKKFNQNPACSLATIRCAPWVRGKVLLLGDAAHGITPFYGQGLNTGLESVRLFVEALDKEGWDAAAKSFTERRKPDTDAIADLSLMNYRELAVLTGDDRFILRKKIEHHFEEKRPDLWRSFYAQSSFSDIPYREVLEAKKKQDAIMDEIMKIPGIENPAKLPEAERVLKRLVNGSSGSFLSGLFGKKN